MNLKAVVNARDRLQAELDAGRQQLPDWGGVHTENQNEKVTDYLYNTLHLPVMVNEDGNPSAGSNQRKDLLALLNEEHKRVEHLTRAEVAEAIRVIELLSYLKERSKLIGYYNPDKVPADCFYHPEWNPAGTATYRFTAHNPPAQTIPKCKCDPACYGENPNCKNARYPFIPDGPDWELISVDIAQAEMVRFFWYA